MREAAVSMQPAGGQSMDIAMVVLTVAFFALSFAYIRVCDNL